MVMLPFNLILFYAAGFVGWLVGDFSLNFEVRFVGRRVIKISCAMRDKMKFEVVF